MKGRFCLYYWTCKQNCKTIPNIVTKNIINSSPLYKPSTKLNQHCILPFFHQHRLLWYYQIQCWSSSTWMSYSSCLDRCFQNPLNKFINLQIKILWKPVLIIQVIQVKQSRKCISICQFAKHSSMVQIFQTYRYASKLIEGYSSAGLQSVVSSLQRQ